MIFVQSRLKVIDNSGALELGCIRLLKESSKKGAKVGDIVVCSVKKNIICKALIVSTKNSVCRKGHYYIKSDSNSVIIINDSGPVANRIFGPIFYELRYKNMSKILSIAEQLV